MARHQVCNGEDNDVAYMKLTRDVFSPEFTLGKLVINSLMLYSVEDCVRDGPKIPSATAIPAGKYKVVITFSNRFQKHLPLLLDVPGFSGIRIHSGNTSEDTEGCILVGTGRTKGGVSNSRYAMSLLMDELEAMRGKDVWLEIT